MQNILNQTRINTQNKEKKILSEDPGGQYGTIHKPRRYFLKFQTPPTPSRQSKTKKKFFEHSVDNVQTWRCSRGLWMAFVPYKIF